MKRAFTLIELLIVVAIIAILAAIAVPNFLEAQVRSKVSRVKADLRSIATALESYAVDNNSYPVIELPPSANPKWVLTTPIAYLTSMPFDVFRLASPSSGTLNGMEKIYLYGENSAKNMARSADPQASATAWVVMSGGPDTDFDVSISDGSGFVPDISRLVFYPEWSPDLFTPAGLASGTGAIQYMHYDPTNGTVSSGDIYRFSDHQSD